MAYMTITARNKETIRHFSIEFGGNVELCKACEIKQWVEKNQICFKSKSHLMTCLCSWLWLFILKVKSQLFINCVEPNTLFIFMEQKGISFNRIFNQLSNKIKEE